jgi:teichuronic acid biosynthesis glycosyltransferase TuaC
MGRPLRVLAVTNTYPCDEMPGDTPCIRDQILAVRDRGVQVDVLHIKRWRKITYLRAACQLFLLSFRRRHYDLIHAYYGHCGLLARLQYKCPVVITFLGSDLLSRRDGTIGRLAARLVEGVIVMSEEMRQVSKRPDAHVIPFGVNTGVFAVRPMEQARQRLGLPLGEKLILFPWSPARAEKRFDLVETALRILQNRYDNVRVVAIHDKPHAVVAEYMNACDVLVLASDHEGSPMAVREALACHLPIVSVDVGDVRQVIGNVEGCYLCKQNAEDLADALGKVLERGQRTRELRPDGDQMMGADWSAEQVIRVYHLVARRAQDG